MATKSEENSTAVSGDVVSLTHSIAGIFIKVSNL
jgi:hypothetical protein